MIYSGDVVRPFDEKEATHRVAFFLSTVATLVLFFSEPAGRAYPRFTKRDPRERFVTRREAPKPRRGRNTPKGVAIQFCRPDHSMKKRPPIGWPFFVAAAIA